MMLAAQGFEVFMQQSPYLLLNTKALEQGLRFAGIAGG